MEVVKATKDNEIFPPAMGVKLAHLESGAVHQKANWTTLARRLSRDLLDTRQSYKNDIAPLVDCIQEFFHIVKEYDGDLKCSRGTTRAGTRDRGSTATTSGLGPPLRRLYQRMEYVNPEVKAVEDPDVPLTEVEERLLKWMLHTVGFPDKGRGFINEIETLNGVNHYPGRRAMKKQLWIVFRRYFNQVLFEGMCDLKAILKNLFGSLREVKAFPQLRKRHHHTAHNTPHDDAAHFFADETTGDDYQSDEDYHTYVPDTTKKSSTPATGKIRDQPTTAAEEFSAMFETSLGISRGVPEANRFRATKERPVPAFPPYYHLGREGQYRPSRPTII